MQKPRNQKRGLDETQLPWEKRHIDPFINMVWNARIWVEPAHAQKGKHIGIRHFPDGSYETFEVSAPV